MWMNLGLFVLVWESVAVLVMAPLRLMMPEAAMADLALAGALTAPLALLITRFMDRCWLDGDPANTNTAEVEATAASKQSGAAADSPHGHAAGVS